MTQGRLLAWLLTGLGIVAVVLAALPFMASLQPSASAGAQLPRIDVSRLSPGHYMSADLPTEQVSGIRLLIIRGRDGALSVYRLPTSRGKVRLPDVTWFREGPECETFGSDSDGDVVRAESVIRCQDAALIDKYPEWSSEWRWSLGGKNLGTGTEDLPRAKYVLEGKSIVYGKS
jgi:hypothetical protein